MNDVLAVQETITLPTYGVGEPERNPAFFEKRVYQGSSGKVYPLPFIDKVSDTATDTEYDSVRLENDYVRVVVLPEIGGRIYIGQDKTNDDYDFFYRNEVIKPALVGLAGPWLSGGVEFNWPQHHRPGTFMPTDVAIEEEEDGAVTVWMSEHDPISRLKGMHGIRIRPDSAVIEARVRLYNRTPFMQTFLWWANVAAEVHENYQSFFPTDVSFVADHACRAMSSFPIANNRYYGIDYQNRPGKNDLTRYTNIPVPTSYMVCRTEFDFFGGYDYDAKGGFVHVADRHISPGKKQWTWGNDEFGWAWDRELTDENGPYVELMAGVYTDNQPDFSYLMPYETKTFSQFWWGYKNLGPVQNANRRAAVRMVVLDDRTMDLGVAVPSPISGAHILVTDGDGTVLETTVDISPDKPWQDQSIAFDGDHEEALRIAVSTPEGEVISFRPVKQNTEAPLPEPASEPPLPRDVKTVEELYLIGEHLEQYRHPTRYPDLYWREALRRDPGDSRSNIALGRLALHRGEFGGAADHFAVALTRLTSRHPNPVTGEAHYYLGLARKFQGRDDEAYKALYKATWNYEWRAAGFYELATIDVRRGNLVEALAHLKQSLSTNVDNNKAIVLGAVIQRRLGKTEDAAKDLQKLLGGDPLDHWARFELGTIEGDRSAFLEGSRNDAQTILDVAFDYADAGLTADAIDVLELHNGNDVTDAPVPNPLRQSPMIEYARAWLYSQAGDADKAERVLNQARELDPSYFFPSRLQEQIVLEWALTQDGEDRNAGFALGNYLFDRKRHEDAIAAWEQARAADPDHATTARNLGIAYWNVRRDGRAALESYSQAVAAAPEDARLLFEHDQLRKKLDHDRHDRLETLLARKDLALTRDDCAVELARLYNETDQPLKALELLIYRRFHPWEGGEGLVLEQYKTAHVLLGRRALNDGEFMFALSHFQNAMLPPAGLGEAYHPLQARADVNYWIGKALKAMGREPQAETYFRLSANEHGDFQEMAVTEHSELSYYRGLSLLELGEREEAKALFDDLEAFARKELSTPARIDYFATSLPTLLVFEQDLTKAKQAHARRLRDLAENGLSRC